MAIRSSVIVGCDTCEVDGIPDNTTIPKGWINFSHRHVEGGVVTYYFCSVACMNSKLEGVIEVRKTKLRRQSGAALHSPVIHDDWPEEWAEAIERKAQEIYERQNARARGIVGLPAGEEPPPHGH